MKMFFKHAVDDKYGRTMIFFSLLRPCSSTGNLAAFNRPPWFTSIHSFQSQWPMTMFCFSMSLYVTLFWPLLYIYFLSFFLYLFSYFMNLFSFSFCWQQAEDVWCRKWRKQSFYWFKSYISFFFLSSCWGAVVINIKWYKYVILQALFQERKPLKNCY